MEKHNEGVLGKGLRKLVKQAEQEANRKITVIQTSENSFRLVWADAQGD